jgi:hypothetical protein
MAIINFKEKIIQIKIVYYGPGRSGKTTNLEYLYNSLKEKFKDDLPSKLITIDTQGDRTLFFDFFPIELGKINGLDLKLQLYTTPGQVMYESTRRLVLKGVDGVIFVADSLASREDANLDSFQNLKDNLAHHKLTMDDIKLVFQWNKRDLEKNGIPLLDPETMDKQLNSELQTKAFPSSATIGTNVFKTLNVAAKMTVESVIEKLLDQKQNLPN